jgi:transposase
LNSEDLVEVYVEKIKPLLPLATKAYGSKKQNTPAHIASREYTRLLKEFADQEGNLILLAKKLGVTYSGVRRRVFTADVPPVTNGSARRKVTEQELSEAIERVKSAKAFSTRAYHEQLSKEYYDNGISLGAIAKGLGIKNASPLYYAVQRHSLRQKEARA